MSQLGQSNRHPFSCGAGKERQSWLLWPHHRYVAPARAGDRGDDRLFQRIEIEGDVDEEARGDTRKGELDGFLYNRTGAVYKIKTIGTTPGRQNYTDNQRLAPGVWHSYDITVTDRTYEVLLNGQPSTKFTADPGDPNERFRGRKKSEDPDSGFIGLQVHTGNVAFANIRIKT